MLYSRAWFDFIMNKAYLNCVLNFNQNCVAISFFVFCFFYKIISIIIQIIKALQYKEKIFSVSNSVSNSYGKSLFSYLDDNIIGLFFNTMVNNITRIWLVVALDFHKFEADVFFLKISGWACSWNVLGFSRNLILIYF